MLWKWWERGQDANSWGGSSSKTKPHQGKGREWWTLLGNGDKEKDRRLSLGWFWKWRTWKTLFCTSMVEGMRGPGNPKGNEECSPFLLQDLRISTQRELFNLRCTGMSTGWETCCNKVAPGRPLNFCHSHRVRSLWRLRTRCEATMGKK